MVFFNELYSLGNGAFLHTLHNYGFLDQMIKAEEIKYLHLCPVDNVLVKLADPAEIGYMEINDLFISSKVLEKLDQEESLGTHTIVDDKPCIIGKYFCNYLERIQ